MRLTSRGRSDDAGDDRRRGRRRPGLAGDRAASASSRRGAPDGGSRRRRACSTRGSLWRSNREADAGTSPGTVLTRAPRATARCRRIRQPPRAADPATVEVPLGHPDPRGRPRAPRTRDPGRSDAIAVRLEGVEKRYGDVVAVDGVDLDVRDGEFFSMLGPSGSGKTTTLRMIAGFELPTAGRILLHGADVTDGPAVRPRRQHGLPGLRPVPAHDRRRQRRLRADGPQGRARPSASGASPRRCGWSASRATTSASPASCRAASASASRSPGRSSTGRACCSSTSRSAPST